MGSRCVPVYPYPILLVETSDGKKFLTISDVHIGCEDRIRRAGILIDAKDNVRDLIESLMVVQERTGINNIIILGDLKSSTSVISRSEWDNVPYFIRSLMDKFTVYIVPGNHDGNLSQLLPTEINLMLVKGMQVDDILFIHGHTVPRITPNLRKIIAGHLHPILKKEGSIISGKKVWVKLLLAKTASQPTDEINSNVRKIEIILLPHFNDLLDYFYQPGKRKNALNKKTKLPFLDNILNKRNWKIENAFIYTLDGSLVGTIKDLDSILY